MKHGNTVSKTVQIEETEQSFVELLGGPDLAPGLYFAYPWFRLCFEGVIFKLRFLALFDLAFLKLKRVAKL